MRRILPSVPESGHVFNALPYKYAPKILRALQANQYCASILVKFVVERKVFGFSLISGHEGNSILLRKQDQTKPDALKINAHFTFCKLCHWIGVL